MEEHTKIPNAHEKSEFNDKVVRNYRIIKPIGNFLILNFRGGKILCGI